LFSQLGLLTLLDWRFFFRRENNTKSIITLPNTWIQYFQWNEWKTIFDYKKTPSSWKTLSSAHNFFYNNPKKVRDAFLLIACLSFLMSFFHWTFHVIVHFFFNFFLQLIHDLHPNVFSMQLYHYSWNMRLDFSLTLSFGW
jgi:hypothetical protein